MDSSSVEHIDITKLIPHRPPMLCVDRLIAATAESTISTFRVPENFMFLKSNYVETAGLLENMAQTIAAGAGLQYLDSSTNTPKAMYLAGFKDIRVYGRVQALDVVITTVELLQQTALALVYQAKVEHKEKTVLSCRLMVVPND